MLALRAHPDLAPQKLEYKSDLSYHQLLYPNESDIRKLLNFLVGKLPKDSPSKLDSANGAHHVPL